MLSKIISYCFLITCSTICFGQGDKIFRNYITPGNDIVFGIIELEDGYILGGASNLDLNPTYSDEPFCPYIVKVDEAGNKVWEVFLRESAPGGFALQRESRRFLINALLKINDKYFYGVGATSTNTGLGTIVVYKFDITGKVIWKYQHDISQSSMVEDVLPIDYKIDSSGNLIVLCKNSPLALSSFPIRNELFKVNSNGQLVWKQYIEKKYQFFTRLSINRPNFNINLFGNTFTHPSQNAPATLSDTASVLILDSTGKYINEKILFFDDDKDSELGNYAFFQAETLGDGITLVGSLLPNDDAIFLYLDSNQNEISRLVFDEEDYFRIQYERKSNSFRYYLNDDIVFMDSGKKEIFRFKTAQHDSFYYKINSVQFAGINSKSGQGYLTGNIENRNSNGFLIEPNSSDIYFLSTDKNGSFRFIKDNLYGLNLFPNPSQEKVYLSFTITEASNVEVKAYNILGGLVTNLYSQETVPGETIISLDISNMPKGIYMIVVETGSTTFTEKLLIN